jgi:hypothetical protein
MAAITGGLAMRLTYSLIRSATAAELGRNAPANVCFASVLAVYLLTAFGLRTLAAKTLLFDEAELLATSQVLALGYGKQPPLASWLLWGFNTLFGPSLAVVLSLRFAVLGLLYVGLYACGRAITATPGRAALGAACVLLIPAVSWDFVLDKTHTPLACVMVAFTIASMLRALRSDHPAWWAATGACVGLGMLSKYTFVPTAGGLAIALLMVPEYRRRVLTKRGGLAIAVAAVIILPHALWLVANQEELVAGVQHSMTDRPHRSAVGTLGLAADVALMSCGIVFAVFAVSVPGVFRRQVNPSSETRLLGHVMVFGAAIAAMLVLLSGGNRFKAHWFTPSAILLPLWLTARMESQEVSRRGWAGLWGAATAAAVGTLVGMGMLGTTGLLRQGEVLQARDRLTLQLADTLGEYPGSVICDSMRDAGNLRLIRPDFPVAVVGTTREARPRVGNASVYVWDATMRDVVSEADESRLVREFGVKPNPGAATRYVGASTAGGPRRRLAVTPLVPTNQAVPQPKPSGLPSAVK